MEPPLIARRCDPGEWSTTGTTSGDRVNGYVAPVDNVAIVVPSHATALCSVAQSFPRTLSNVWFSWKIRTTFVTVRAPSLPYRFLVSAREAVPTDDCAPLREFPRRASTVWPAAESAAHARAVAT